MSLLLKLLPYLLGALAIGGGFYYATSVWCNSVCKEVKADWETDKAMRIKRTTEITLDLSNKLSEAQDAAAKQTVRTIEVFRPIHERVGHVVRGPGISLPGDVAGVLDSASSAANSARPDAGTEARADPVPDRAATATFVYDESEIATYFVDSAAAYADAYNLWAAARAREDACYTALDKGLNP